MSTDALLTILGLVVAVYSVLTPLQRLDLNIRVGPGEWTVAIAAFAVLHYLTFFDALVAAGLTQPLGTWPTGLDNAKASYLVVLAAVVVLGLALRFARVGRLQVRNFAKLCNQLIGDAKYGELVPLLERHFDPLRRLARIDTVSARFVSWLEPGRPLRVKWINGNMVFKTPAPALLRRLSAPVVKKLGLEPADCARRVLIRLRTHPGVIEAVVTSRLPLFLKMTDVGDYHDPDFLDQGVRLLLRRPGSSLFQEIQRNQNLVLGNRYALDPDNFFICHFLRDARVAHRSNLWRPFGEFFLDELHRLKVNPVDDGYAGGMGNYDERGRWACPLHATIRFFDIMVLEALHQGVEWHMHLFYFSYFTKEILTNMPDRRPEPDEVDEWPSRYHFLLYQCISVLGDWLDEAHGIDDGRTNVRIQSTRTDFENESIGKSALLALGMCVKACVVSEKLSERFKSYLLEVVTSRYVELRGKPHSAAYREALARSLMSGGSSGPHDRKYLRQLADAIPGRDVLRSSELRRDPYLSVLWQGGTGVVVAP